MKNSENKKKFNYTILFASIIGLLIVIAGMLITYAFFNYTRTGSSNTLATAPIFFEFADGNQNIDIGNAYPISYSDIGTINEMTFTLKGSSELVEGLKYTIYAVEGDTVSGKNRLSYNVMSMVFEPATDADGYTTVSNNFVTPTSPDFTNGKITISTGVIRNSNSELAAKTYKLKMWIDSSKILVSSTTKRQNNSEGNPSVADTTSGNVIEGRYIENDNNLVDTTLYPASIDYSGRVVYTTNEFLNSYYSIKILVEATENS